MNSRIRKQVRSLKAYVPGEQPAWAGIVKLNTNENPYPPSARVIRALGSLDASALRLYPDPVWKPLRKRIAEIHGCGEAQVFVGNGSDEILALCTRAFVESDGTVGYFNPSYSLYPVLAAIQGARTKPVELGGDFEWRMGKGYRCSLFFLTNPNAPTGMLYPKSVVRAFCAAQRGVVVIDEAYVDFSREDCMDLALRMKNVLAVRTLSKSFSLAGLRVGYAVGAADLIEALMKVKDSYNVGRFAQELALAALNDLPAMRRNVRRIRGTRDRLARALAAMGHRVYPSETNFLWVRPGGIRAKELFDRLREERIVIRYFPGRRTGACVRITVGTDPQADRLIEAVKRLNSAGETRDEKKSRRSCQEDA